jgi:pimeloyl-ACP methyl ester carboxylesterase
MMTARFRWSILVFLLLALSPGMRVSSQDGASAQVVLPDNYDASKSYGVVEFLISESLLQAYLSDLNPDAMFAPLQEQFSALISGLFGQGMHAGRDFILVLSAAGSADYRTADAWTKTITRFETAVLSDIATLGKKYRVDASRVVVAGFSVAADIAWALALRNPAKLRGAIIMSSRASYRLGGGYGALAKGSRFYLTIGGAEDSSRVAGARAAAALLKTAKVPSLYCETRQKNHRVAPPEVFAEALDFVLAARSTTVPARSGIGACQGK